MTRTSEISANRSETETYDPVTDAINKLRAIINRGNALLRRHYQNKTQTSSVSFGDLRSTSFIDSSCVDIPESNNIYMTFVCIYGY